MIGAPVYGHDKMVGGFFGASHARVHAPVAAFGSAAVGLKQGAQTVPVGQTSCGSRSASLAISGRHVERHRPSAPAIDVHAGGTPSPPDSVIVSARRTPPRRSSSYSSRAATAPTKGRATRGRQWAPLQAGLHAGKVTGR